MNRSTETSDSQVPGARRWTRRTTALTASAVTACALVAVLVAPAEAGSSNAGGEPAQIQRLQSQVDQLTARMTTLSTDLDAERAAHQQDVKALTGALAAEETARVSGDSGLTDSVQQLTTQVGGVDDGLANLTAGLGDLNSKVAALRTDLTAETTSRTDQDENLRALIRQEQDLRFQFHQESLAVSVDAAKSATKSLDCVHGSAVAGGFLPDSDETSAARYLMGSAPTHLNTGWQVRLDNSSFTSWEGTVYAVCATYGEPQ
jgi:outer membrane murein-binding lipoprotein Lpp